MKKLILSFIPILLLCASCVTKKKFVEAEDGRIAALMANRDLRNRLADTTSLLLNCQSNSSFLNSQIANLKKESASQKNQLSSTLSERERTIREMQNMINEQQRKVQNLLTNVENALMGFNSDELTVTKKNGKVYVALSDKLLFASGSANVDKRGSEALGKLAEVLNRQTDVDVYIEGHTDNVPIRTAQFKDNWDLSVIRATSVVRILIDDYRVNPLQIQPTGRGQFMPLSDNSTAEGRSKNRRTEIIMAPRIDKLLDMLQVK